jgi:hypothetical protein
MGSQLYYLFCSSNSSSSSSSSLEDSTFEWVFCCQSKFNGSIVKIVSQIGDFQAWTLDWTAPMKGTICKPYTVQEAWNNMGVILETQVTVVLCVNLTRKMVDLSFS